MNSLIKVSGLSLVFAITACGSNAQASSVTEEAAAAHADESIDSELSPAAGSIEALVKDETVKPNAALEAKRLTALGYTKENVARIIALQNFHADIALLKKGSAEQAETKDIAARWASIAKFETAALAIVEVIQSTPVGTSKHEVAKADFKAQVAAVTGDIYFLSSVLKTNPTVNKATLGILDSLDAMMDVK